MFFNVLFEDKSTKLLARLKQIRVNASKLSHEELDECTELDKGNAVELAKEIKVLVEKYNFNIIKRSKY